MGNDYIKHRKILSEFDTEEQARAITMAKAIARGRKDPVFFGEYFLGLRFHDLQKIWLWLTSKTQIEKAYELAMVIGYPLPTLGQLLNHPFLKNVLCPSNRFGKTFCTSVKHIWFNFYKIGVSGNPRFIHDTRYSTLNISPHSLQVDAAYRYIIDIFQNKLIYTWEGNKIRNNCLISDFLVDHKQIRREIIFANNATIKGVPTGEDQASSLAGTQFFYISYDEAPQSMHLRNELPAKIQSRLIDSGGPLDIIGTPEVDRPSHAYYQRITKQGLNLEEGFFTLTGKLKDNIFIGQEERTKTLEAIRQTDPAKYRQVAFGDFITTGAKMFDGHWIQNLWADIPMMTTGLQGRSYILSADWGFSDTGDPTVFYVIDYTRLRELKRNNSTDLYRIVYREHHKGKSPYEVLARLRVLQDAFNGAQIIHDASSMGGVMIKKMLREIHVNNIYDFTITKSGKDNRKDEMLFLLARSMSFGRKIAQSEDGKIIDVNLNYGKIKSYLIPELEEQLGNYRVDDKKLEQDDVMALGMAIWYLERKFSGHQVKVFDLNILSDVPEKILTIPSDVNIKTNILDIKERSI